MSLLSGTSMLTESKSSMITREQLLEEGKALEIKPGFFLFSSINPERQELETFEEYKFRQKIVRRTGKRFLKGKL